MSEDNTAPKKERIQIIDALRGLAIILMVLHHLGIDLVSAGLMDPYVIYNPLLEVAQPIFAGLFILLSGVSSRFSRSNLRRGFICFALGVGLSIVTSLYGTPIDFGILHFLGVSMMIYGAAGQTLEKIPRIIQPFLWGAAFAAAYIFFPIHVAEAAGGSFYFQWFGIITSTFLAYDFFPLLPWLFLFLFGTWLGGIIREGRFPRWFYTLKIPFLPFVGRHTLLIYLLHQPIILLVLMLLGVISI